MMHNRLPFEAKEIVMEQRTELHDIAPGEDHLAPNGSALRAKIMLSATHHNLSIVMRGPIP